MSAVPPELLRCSLLPVSTKTLLSHAQLTSHLLISYDMFGLRLLKCYSYPFTLRSSHCPSLTGNDNGYYFSSSSPFSDCLTIFVIITHGLGLVNIFLIRYPAKFPHSKGIFHCLYQKFLLIHLRYEPLGNPALTFSFHIEISNHREYNRSNKVDKQIFHRVIQSQV